ncbi:MAG: nucleotidyltransferase domain-containing protein [Polaromonas sp.]|nr:nucleotidyltransferase domain-containing protein [Polaromonas sp.]
MPAPDWLEVRRVLAAQVPQLEVWAFGSRATGTPKPHSDLDLALITEMPLSLTQLANVVHAFELSDLSIHVDVVDWASASKAFQRIISTGKVVLQHAPGESRSG